MLLVYHLKHYESRTRVAVKPRSTRPNGGLQHVEESLAASHKGAGFKGSRCLSCLQVFLDSLSCLFVFEVFTSEQTVCRHHFLKHGSVQNPY